MTRDEFLTEYLKDCWHDLDWDHPTLISAEEPRFSFPCKKCGEPCEGNSYDVTIYANRGFGTWPQFGKLFEQADDYHKHLLTLLLDREKNLNDSITEYAKALEWKE